MPHRLSHVVIRVTAHWCRLVRGAAITTALLAAVPSVAHHSYALFDGKRTRTLEGVVESFSWVNPHVSFKILVIPAAASKMESWNIESHSPSILQRYGWTRNSLTPGMRVRIVCIPASDGSHTCRLLTALLLDRQETLETKLSKSYKSPQR